MQLSCQSLHTDKVLTAFLHAMQLISPSIHFCRNFRTPSPKREGAAIVFFKNRRSIPHYCAFLTYASGGTPQNQDTASVHFSAHRPSVDEIQRSSTIHFAPSCRVSLAACSSRRTTYGDPRWPAFIAVHLVQKPRGPVVRRPSSPS